MGYETIKSRIEKLEEAYGRKEPFVIILTHPSDSTPPDPPDVLIVGDDMTPEEERVIRVKVLTEWRAKRGVNIQETDPAVLEARIAALEARVEGKKGNHGTKRKT